MPDTLVPPIHEKFKHAVPPDIALPAADPAAVLFQPVHDLRLVWPPALQGGSALGRDRDELGDRLRGILFAVPANRYGNAVYSAAELKTIQEVITLLVFAGFSLVYLREPIGWNHLVGFGLISAGAFFIFQKW